MANAQTIAVRREHFISAHAPAADGEPLRPGHTPLGVGIRRQGEAYKQPGSARVWRKGLQWCFPVVRFPRDPSTRTGAVAAAIDVKIFYIPTRITHT